MSTALFLSPHLDDVAFSCGGTLARLKTRGWTVALVTVFTRSVLHPTGFALACQTNKGVAPEVDYMALRREEDQDFAALMRVDRLVWADLPEAPHRGYVLATIFSPPHEEDAIGAAVVDKLVPLLNELRPDLVFAPQALGSHVDHVQLVRALPALGIEPSRMLWYRDTPYAVREPHAQPDFAVPRNVRPLAVDVTAELSLKVAGCNRYRTQVDFQFGGPRAVALTLDAFHRREAHAHGRTGCAEVFLADGLAPDVWEALVGEVR
ncbi:PIG-L deacetylase family protein [Melittangium boletus]|uniref:N-acetylglucosaminylphosphatidylinositol deacetylase n=1 Tax=Melittangium boletus DSM 14713 TaxID=1294270 RepID=A0A250IBP5_9BACT|nr:PIG-L family deacetylase [Melittangium boletus]ATB28592.1 N-acetylglucosaminylphosphatidylinositol deacetylase [Melittangium boletus DSM 14713]